MLSVLLVGFGYSATTFHLPFLTSIAGFNVSGVVSTRTKDVQRQLPAAKVFDNLEDALQSIKPDLSIITTPNHLHFSQAKSCLSGGSHVLVEKPFTLEAADADALIALAQASKRKISVFQNRRWDGDFLTLQKLLEEKKVGQLRRLSSRFDRFRPDPRDRWRENAGPGSGIFWDLAPHLIDQSLQLFENPHTVSGHLLQLRPKGESCDAFSLTFHYNNHVVELGSSPFQAASNLRFELQGDAGSYRKFGLDPQEGQLKAGVSWQDPTWAVTPTDEDGNLFTDEGVAAVTTEKGRYQDFFLRLRDAIEKDAAVPGDAHSVLEVMRIMEKIDSLGRQYKPFIFQIENV